MRVSCRLEGTNWQGPAESGLLLECRVNGSPSSCTYRLEIDFHSLRGLVSVAALQRFHKGAAPEFQGFEVDLPVFGTPRTYSTSARLQSVIDLGILGHHDTTAAGRASKERVHWACDIASLRESPSIQDAAPGYPYHHVPEAAGLELPVLPTGSRNAAMISP